MYILVWSLEIKFLGFNLTDMKVINFLDVLLSFLVICGARKLTRKAHTAWRVQHMFFNPTLRYSFWLYPAILPQLEYLSWSLLVRVAVLHTTPVTRDFPYFILHSRILPSVLKPCCIPLMNMHIPHPASKSPVILYPAFIFTLKSSQIPLTLC